MTLIAFGSARHSPGVTTTVLALAAAWPSERQVLVVEADPAGGDLICYFRLLLGPSLLSLAAAGRSDVIATDVWEHAQQLPGDSQVSAVVAPVDPRQVGAALATLARAGLAYVLAHLDADVLLDVGRLDPDSAAFALFSAAQVRVVVGRPTLNQADHLQLRSALLAAQNVSPVHLLVVGEGTWSSDERPQHRRRDPAGCPARRSPGGGGRDGRGARGPRPAPFGALALGPTRGGCAGRRRIVEAGDVEPHRCCRRRRPRVPTRLSDRGPGPGDDKEAELVALSANEFDDLARRIHGEVSEARGERRQAAAAAGRPLDHDDRWR